MSGKQYTVRLEDNTVGTMNITQVQDINGLIGEVVTVSLRDENGNSIEKQGKMVEVLDIGALMESLLECFEKEIEENRKKLLNTFINKLRILSGAYCEREETIEDKLERLKAVCKLIKESLTWVDD